VRFVARFGYANGAVETRWLVKETSQSTHGLTCDAVASLPSGEAIFAGRGDGKLGDFVLGRVVPDGKKGATVTLYKDLPKGAVAKPEPNAMAVLPDGCLVVTGKHGSQQAPPKLPVLIHPAHAGACKGFKKTGLLWTGDGQAGGTNPVGEDLTALPGGGFAILATAGKVGGPDETVLVIFNADGSEKSKRFYRDQHINNYKDAQKNGVVIHVSAMGIETYPDGKLAVLMGVLDAAVPFANPPRPEGHRAWLLRTDASGAAQSQTYPPKNAKLEPPKGPPGPGGPPPLPLDWYDPLTLASFGDDSVAVATLYRPPPKPQGGSFLVDDDGYASVARFGRYLHVPPACEVCDMKTCNDNGVCTLDDCSAVNGIATCKTENKDICGF